MKFKSYFSQSFLWTLLLLSVLAAGCDSFGGKDNPGDKADLAQLAGDWIRVESNNPSSDFMKVKVTGSSGTITDKAGSGFNNGDVKWSTITPEGKEVFAYEELGSDYNYYAGTITLISDNELRISISSSGAGNDQKWLRDDGTIVDTTAAELSCNVDADLVLVNTAAPIDYIVDCVIDVTAKLTIEPGVVIVFKENAGLGIYDAGALNAVGTATEPIVFKGENAVQGYWRGIHTETNTINNRLEFVRIEDAGSNYVYCCNQKAGLFVKDGKMALRNSTIRNSGAFGLYVGTEAELVDFENNTITGSKEAAAYLPFEATAFLDGLGSDYTGNGEDYIRIYRATVDEVTSTPPTNVPYLLDAEVFDITKGLTLQAGVNIEVKENGGLGVYDDGSLKIAGTASAPVSIKGAESVRGFWRGIHIETNSLNNQLQHVQISDAGSNYVYCCNIIASVFVKGGTVSIENSRLSNGKGYGIYANDDASFRTYSNNTVETHTLTPLYLAANRVAELDGTGSNYTNNDENFLGIFNSNIDEEITWPKAKVPYLVDGVVIDVTKGLTIEAGTEIVFKSDGGLGVYDQGYIKAEGSSGNEIIFRGRENTPGYWRGLYSETNSSNNVIAHASILNAGSNYVYCCDDKAGLMVKDGTMVLTNSQISGSGGCGVIVKAAATLTESGNTFSNNADGNICN